MNVTVLRKFVQKAETYHDICMILKQTETRCSEHNIMDKYYLLKRINYKENKIDEIRLPLDDTEIISIDLG